MGITKSLPAGRYKTTTMEAPPPGIEVPTGEWVLFYAPGGMPKGALPKTDYADAVKKGAILEEERASQNR